MTNDTKEFADQVVTAMKSFVATQLSAFEAKLSEKIEQRIAAVPVACDGANGRDGKDGAAGVDGARGEKGEPGDQGNSGKDGADGRDGGDGLNGKDGIDGVTGADGRHGKDGEKGEKGDRGDPGKDGANGDDGTHGLDGKDGRDGKDGATGRDALQIDILAGIDETKSYVRGIFASHRGGLIRSFRTTDAVEDGLERAGWSVIIDGEASDEMDLVDERTFERVKTFTSGRKIVKRYPVPTMIYRDVFKHDQVYERGDTVTWAGSTWHCNQTTSDQPGVGSGWTLAAKRGRDGADGVAIQSKSRDRIKV